MDVVKLKMALRHCPIAACQTCVYFSDKGCTVHEDSLKYITQLEARLAAAEETLAAAEETLSQIDGYVRELQEAVRT